MQHLDEGMIHAWLDGQLPRDEAQAVEAHVAECRQCADAVAEARGLIAASSRILMALDGVPREVVPLPTMPRVAAGAVTGAPSSDTANAPLRAERRAQRRWFSGPSLAAAATVVVAVGTFALMRAGNRPALDTAETSQARSAVSGPFVDSIASPVAPIAASPAPPAPASVALGGSSTAPGAAKDAAAPAEVRAFRDEAGGRQSARTDAALQANAEKTQQQQQGAQAATQQAFSAKTAVAGAANEQTTDRLELRRQVAGAPPSAAADERKKEAREQLPLPLAKPNSDSSSLVVIRGRSALAERMDTSAARADAPAKQQASTTGVLRGRVIDGNNTGLAGAMVSIVGSTTGVATNSAGEFTLGGLPPGERQLTVRRIGYAEVKRDVAIVAGQTVTVDVTLSPSVLTLNSVVTTASPSSSPPAATSAPARRAPPSPEPAPGAPITATQSNAVGCYDLGITPTASQPRSGFRQVPRRIALDSEMVPANAEGVWYRARDLARVGTTPNGLWRPAGPDAIELEWTYGTRTSRVRLAGPAGSMMRGTIEEIDRAAATGEAGTVVAVRRPCDG